jgi:hypothetical protein
MITFAAVEGILFGLLLCHLLAKKARSDAGALFQQ